MLEYSKLVNVILFCMGKPVCKAVGDLVISRPRLESGARGALTAPPPRYPTMGTMSTGASTADAMPPHSTVRYRGLDALSPIFNFALKSDNLSAFRCQPPSFGYNSLAP
jgi:hypothetical protein